MTTKSEGRRVQGHAEIMIDAPRDKVWSVLGEEFDNIGLWSSSVKRSHSIEPENADAIGAPVGGRFCEIAAMGFSDTHERILEYRPPEFISYELFEGLPGFVSLAVNSWTLDDRGQKTRLVGHTDMYVKGLMGRLMGGFMKASLDKALDGMCREVKYYIEKGQPHPNKAKSIRKHGNPTFA